MSYLQELEEEFWLGGADVYRRLLAKDAVMVFADPVATLDREATIASIASGPRWTEVVLDEVQEARLAEDVSLLTYRATARRPGDVEPYTARAGSVYVRSGGEWRLAYHQQST